MQKMDHKKCLAKLLLYFGILHYLPRATSQIEAFVGDPVSIPCNVTGTFQLPEWTFGLITITNQGNPLINPAFTRLQYASDQKNLRLTNAQLNDTGNYVCTHTAGTATTSLTVKKTPTTTTSPTTSSTTTSPTTSPTTSTTTSPTTSSTASTTTTSPEAPPTNSSSTPRSAEEKGFTKTIMIIVIICSCAAAAIVVFIVLLVIRHWKHQKEKKSPNEMVDFEGQNVNSCNEFMAISNINMGDSQ